MGFCRIEYPDIANIHLETAVAPELIKEAYERLWMRMCMFHMFKRILKMRVRIFCIQDK